MKNKARSHKITDEDSKEVYEYKFLTQSRITILQESIKRMTAFVHNLHFMKEARDLFSLFSDLLIIDFKDSKISSCNNECL